MFDKQAQRARAAQISNELAAQGLAAPVLNWPTPKPVPPAPAPLVIPVLVPAKKRGKQVLDMAGKPIEIGDEVVYTWYNTAAMMKGKVVGFSSTKKSVLVEGRGARKWRPGLQKFYRPVNAIVKV